MATRGALTPKNIANLPGPANVTAGTEMRGATMLLRRMTQHVKDQNWFAVALDFVIVVAGILIAFQITNWNQARQNQDLASTYIERLYSDIDIERALWSRAIDYYATARSYADEGMAGYSAPPETLDSQWLIALYQASQVWYVSPNRSTFDELQSTGRIVNIRDQDLRTILANHYQRVAQTGFTLVQNSQYRRIARLHLHEDVQSQIRANCGDQWVTDDRNFYYVALPRQCDIDLPADFLRSEIIRMQSIGAIREELRFHQSVLGAQLGVMRNATETADATLNKLAEAMK